MDVRDPNFLSDMLLQIFFDIGMEALARFWPFLLLYVSAAIFFKTLEAGRPRRRRRRRNSW
jgi:hypothetical protein